MNKIFKFIAILGLVYIVGYMGAKILTQYFGVVSGDKAPNIHATTIHGKEFSLSDFKDKYVLIDFWGSWCPPCIKELPNMVAIHEKYGNEIVIISIALEKSANNWKRISQRYGINWEYQVVDYNKLVLMSSLARTYGVTDIPAKFLIDPEGKLIKGMSFQEIEVLLSSKFD